MNNVMKTDNFLIKILWILLLPITIVHAHNSNLDKLLDSPLLTNTILMTNSFADAVYAINPDTHNVLFFSGGNGTSQFPIVASGIQLQTPQDITVLNSGTIVVSDSELKALIKIDPVTGNRTLFSIFPLNLGPAFEFPTQMVVDKTTGIIYVSDSNFNGIFAVDPDTGDRSIAADNTLGSGPLFERVAGIALGDTGKLFVTDSNKTALFEVDIISGDRRIISGDPDGLNIGSGISVISNQIDTLLNGNIVFIARFFDDNSKLVNKLFSIDPVVGDRIIISDDTIGTGPLFDFNIKPIAVNDDGQVILGNNTLFEVDPVTGNRTIIVGSGVGNGDPFVGGRSIFTLPSDKLFKNGFEENN